VSTASGGEEGDPEAEGAGHDHSDDDSPASNPPVMSLRK
jgi:hypothetical protein